MLVHFLTHADVRQLVIQRSQSAIIVHVPPRRAQSLAPMRGVGKEILAMATLVCDVLEQQRKVR